MVRCSKFIWNRTSNPRTDLDDPIYFFTLWAWCKNNQSVRWTQWRTQSMWLVFATGWIAAMVHYFLVGHSKPNEIVELCKHHMRERNIERGNFYCGHIQTRMFSDFIFIFRWSTQPFHTLWHCAISSYEYQRFLPKNKLNVMQNVMFFREQLFQNTI